MAEKYYKQDEDPKLFKSNKTGRGPLGPDWTDDLRKNQNENKMTFMCVYINCVRSSVRFGGFSPN